MAQIVRGEASSIDALEPLWLAEREHQASVTTHWGELRPPAEGWARRSSDYRAILEEGGALFLAREGGALVGFLICEQEEGGSPTWSWPRDYLAVVDVSVLPDHRGRGVGRALLEAAEAEARDRGVAALDLMVAAPNDGARRFYERHGFRADLVTYRKPL